MTVLDGSRRATPAEKRLVKRSCRELVGASRFYVALVPGSVHGVERFSGAGKVLVALLPLIGAAVMVVAIVRFVLRTDELQRRTLAGAGHVWPIGVGTWAVVLPFIRRRYL